MADKNVFNDKDSIDINELASLNEDISPELIEQLQQKLSQEAISLNKSTSTNFDLNDDVTLFEEPENKEENTSLNKASETPDNEKINSAPKDLDIDKNFDDNFIKKYKAKLNKQKESGDNKQHTEAEETISNAAFSESSEGSSNDENIEKISEGNISERKLTQTQKNYNDSLDLLDGNIKYSKYVIYIAPENVEFIDSLTIKERKNLINKILKEQDDIAITKHRFKVINTVIKHVIVAVLTITVSIPVIYWTINASLEATINNYRRSQSIFQTLYRENGKITNIK